MPRVSSLSPSLRLLIALATAAAFGIAPASAAAAPAPTLVFELKDASGDAASAVDIVSAVVTQDRAAGVLKADVTFAGDPVGAQAYLHVGFGHRDYGECVSDRPGAARLISPAFGPEAGYGILAPTKVGGPATKVVNGSTVNLTSDADPGLLSATTWNCTKIEILRVNAGGEPDYDRGNLDTVSAFAPKEVQVQGPVAPPPVNGQALVLDADGDAVPDSADQCKDVPGARTDGCPTTSDARSLRLGAKRLVVDRLLPLTGKKCPVAVKATVSVKGRTLGKQRIGVIAHGAYCHVAGKVSLKKRAKKVRVVITGSGVGSVKAVVAA